MEKMTMTKAQKFTAIRALLENSVDLSADEKEMYLTFIDHEIELLSKKSTSKKEKANSDSNDLLAENILEILDTEKRLLTVGNLLEKLPKVDSLERPVTCQRITSILVKLVKAGKVDKSIEKRISYYSIIQ